MSKKKIEKKKEKIKKRRKEKKNIKGVVLIDKKNNPKKSVKKKTLQKKKEEKKSNKKISKKKSETKTIVKKSLTTKKKRKKQLKTSFLIMVFFLSLSVISLVLFILLSQTNQQNKTSVTPIPHRLSTVTNEKTFIKIKNSLLQNALNLDKEKTNICSGSDFFNAPKEKIVYAQNKFTVILKRGKLFVVNTTTNRFISYTEISPYPLKENNAITYDNLFLNDNTLIVTGYRANTNSLEISTFLINSLGRITRGTTYDLPTSSCNFGANFNGDKIIFYTSRPLKSKTTIENINLLNEWDIKSNNFTPVTIKNSTVFYDNASHLNTPIIHSITSCRIQNSVLINCQQRHLLGNNSSGHYLDKNNFYLWTAELPPNTKSNKNIPNSKLYQFDLSTSTIKMTQVVGKPVTKNALTVKDNRKLIATIYQNNSVAPSWQTNFTKNKIANFQLNINEFSQDGSFVNSSDNYELTSLNFKNITDTSENILIASPTLITLNHSVVTKYSKDGSTKKITIDGQILKTKKTSNQQITIIIQKNTALLVQIVNLNDFTISEPLTLQENITTVPSVKIHSLKKDNLIDISIIEKSLNKGYLYLLDTSKNTPTILNNFVFNNRYQRLNDGCQNDCQQSWQDQANYFTSSPDKTTGPNKSIYATVGSKLKKFIIDKTGILRPVKTIDYTYKPAPPKPKRPRARIPGGAKLVNGKYVCKKKHDYVGKSKKNNKGYLHLDLECCLDPDEYPNPWCTYRPGELNVTKLRYKDYHGNIKRKKH